MKTLIVCAALLLGVITTSAVAANDAQARFFACQKRLLDNGTWNRYPRGYCRREANYYVGAPTNVRPVKRSTNGYASGGSR